MNKHYSVYIELTVSKDMQDKNLYPDSGSFTKGAGLGHRVSTGGS